MEKVDEHTLFITEIAAYLHDIGVKISKEKYGNSQPQHQETESPIIAKNMLSKYDLPAEDVERICFIIGHHHTYKAIDGIDFQILVEADDGFRLCALTRQTAESRPTSEACLDQSYYIVNLMEGYCKRESIPEMKKNVFKTESGLYLLQQMFEKSKR